MLRFLKFSLLFPIAFVAANAATYRLEYTFDVKYVAPGLSLNVGELIHGWFNFDASVADGDPGDPTHGSYSHALLAYGFTSHVFETPPIDWSFISVANNQPNGPQFFSGYDFYFGTLGGLNLHVEEVVLSIRQRDDVPTPYLPDDSIPTSNAWMVFPSEFGSSVTFRDATGEKSVEGMVTAVTIRPLSVPEGASTGLLLGLPLVALLGRRVIGRHVC